MYELKLGNLIIESLCLLRCFKNISKTSADIITYLSRPVFHQLELYNFFTKTEHIKLVTLDTSKYCIYKLSNNEWIVSGNMQPKLTTHVDWRNLLAYMNNILARTITGIYYCNADGDCQAIFNSRASLSANSNILHSFLLNSNYTLSASPLDISIPIPCKCPKTFIDVAFNALMLLNPFVLSLPKNLKNIASSPHLVLYSIDNSQTVLVKFKDHKWMIQYISGDGMIQDTTIVSSNKPVFKTISQLAGKITEIQVFTGLQGSQPIVLKL